MAMTDFHIHTNIRPWDDGQEDISPESIIAYAQSNGYSAVGISPHVHFDCDAQALADVLRRQCQQANPTIDCFIGAEVECIDENGTLTVSPQQADMFDYIIAAPDHYNCNGVCKPPKDMKSMLESHQKLLLQLAANPMVDVIAHPWAALILLTCEGHLGGYDNIEDISAVPESGHYELAKAARESGTAVEINGFFVGKYLNQRKELGHSYEQQYFRFFEILAGEGVILSPNSDAHSLAQLAQANDAWNWCEKLNLPASQIWQPGE